MNVNCKIISQIPIFFVKTLSLHFSRRNSKLICDKYEFGLTKENALKIIEKYDVILDCTDNVLTRYLINDCCVLTNRPLVSGSALRYDGQLTVYNYNNGPCLRCIYPKPPPNETINNCSDAGILGPIVGSIGTFQAIEAIKILTGIGETLSGRLLIYNGFDFMSRVVNLRKNKKPDCSFCNKQITSIDSFDYVLFCGSNSYDDKVCFQK
jgi:adenylyltransferase and sulfurtransferase